MKSLEGGERIGKATNTKGNKRNVTDFRYNNVETDKKGDALRFHWQRKEIQRERRHGMVRTAAGGTITMNKEHGFENGIQQTWTTIENGVIDDEENFDGLEKLTFIVCIRHSFQIGGTAYISQPNMAKKVGCTDRTIRNHLESLAEKGFLERLGIHPEKRTVIWKTIIPDHVRRSYLQKELDRMSNKPQKKEKPPEDDSDKKPENVPHGEIIEYLNTKTGKQFKSTGKDTQKHIRARWRDGFRLEEFKKVIDNMASIWLGDEKMDQYLRPKTLFGTKFESYLNTKPKRSGPSFDHHSKPQQDGSNQISDQEIAAMLDDIDI